MQTITLTPQVHLTKEIWSALQSLQFQINGTGAIEASAWVSSAALWALFDQANPPEGAEAIYAYRDGRGDKQVMLNAYFKKWDVPGEPTQCPLTKEDISEGGNKVIFTIKSVEYIDR